MVQWQAKNLALTYPRCDETPEDVLRRIRGLFGSLLLTALVARERHADGSNHLHCYVGLSAPYRCRNNSGLDSLAKQHGNYQACRSPRQWLKYITKEKDYLLYGKSQEWLSSYLQGKSSATSEVHSQLLAGKSLKDVIRENPWTLTKVRQLEAALPYLATKKAPEKVYSSPLVGIGSPTSMEATLGTWFNTNVKSALPRPIRCPQLWLHGAPGTGKTSLISRLSRMLSIYHVSDENFYNDYQDDMFDLAVFDEYNNGRKTIGWLNRWLDGSILPLAQKGGGTTKRQNIPTVILSNFHPRDVYAKVNAERPIQMEALIQRLEIIEIPEQEHLHNLWPEAFLESLADSAAPAEEEVPEEDSFE